MLKLARTTSINKDFQTLVRKLDIELWKRNGEEQSIFEKYNIVKDLDSVVVAYFDYTSFAVACSYALNYTIRPLAGKIEHV